MIKQIKKIIFTASFIFLYSIRIFAAEHHTSWNGDENVSYEIVNNDIPYFTEEEKLRTDVWEIYSPLDELGRCGVAYANLCKELLPTEKRKDISKVYPSGWKYNGKSNNHQYKKLIKGNGYIFNRSHLIAFALAGENDNKLNLITGTDWMNHKGMYEEAEKDTLGYIKKTNNHVLYRVTPIYEKDNLVAEGVRIEAYSVEDKGEGICFNRFYYNIQPGVEIDYKTGQNWLKTEDINSNSNNQQEKIDYDGHVDGIEPYFRKIGETNPPIPKFSDEVFTQEGLENTQEPVIITTTEDITDTISIRKETSEEEITAINEKIETALTTIKIIFPIIISTMILIFVVLFTDKILKRKKKKK